MDMSRGNVAIDEEVARVENIVSGSMNQTH
jgi:hypothetical protein